MLEVKDLHVNYGAVHALNGISLHVDDGEIVSLIGANGAGKTTTLRTITGLEKAASGSVMFDGHDLRKAEPSKIITYKLAHVPEGRAYLPPDDGGRKPGNGRLCRPGRDGRDDEGCV